MRLPARTQSLFRNLQTSRTLTVSEILRATRHQATPHHDSAVIPQAQIPIQNQPVSGPPTWLIEILSPDKSTTKLIAKIQTCLVEGARLGWLIDSQEKIVMVFQLQQPLKLLTDDALLPVMESIELTLTPAQIFDWLSTSQ